MAVRGSAMHKNHNPILYTYRVISTLPFSFIMDACLSHIFGRTKGI